MTTKEFTEAAKKKADAKWEYRVALGRLKAQENAEHEAYLDGHTNDELAWRRNYEARMNEEALHKETMAQHGKFNGGTKKRRHRKTKTRRNRK
jgi:hypothetical protein